MSKQGESPAGAELLELAALYALDALEAGERQAFERELAGNAELQAEVDSLREAAGALGAAAPEADPPPGLGDRLMAAARGGRKQPEGVLLDRDGLLIVQSAAVPSRPSPIEGVSVRLLHLDRETGRMTSLVELKAGAVYPGHRHAAVEELFVVQGEAEVHGILMGPGDYCRASPDSVHEPTRALTDAVILIRNSVHDEVRQ